MKLKGNLIYGQSGGPTSVINSTFVGLYKEAKRHKDIINKIFCMKNGISGLINNNLIDTNKINEEEIDLLTQTPGAAFGSIRYKLDDPNSDSIDYINILNCLKSHDIRYIFYNGGNDSMDTCNKLSIFLKRVNYECRVIGLPKTIDNDLPFIDHTPGFGSAAKFVINTIINLSYESKCYPSGRVNIVEIMGRDAGWLTASSYLANKVNEGPDLIYIPEVNFDEKKFIQDVKAIYKAKSHALIAVSEGIKDKNGNFISEDKTKLDIFGHSTLRGASHYLSDLLEKENIKTRAIELSLLQRCSSYLSCKQDINEAMHIGAFALKKALAGYTGFMASNSRTSNEPYILKYTLVPLSDVANIVKTVPTFYINKDGNNMNEKFYDYIVPLIDGERKLKFVGGMIKLAKI